MSTSDFHNSQTTLVHAINRKGGVCWFDKQLALAVWGKGFRPFLLTAGRMRIHSNGDMLLYSVLF